MLDEDLSDEAEFTVDVDEAEYNEEDDADLHLNKLAKRKTLQCNTIDSLPCGRSAFGLSHNLHVTKLYCLRRGTTPLTVLKNLSPTPVPEVYVSLHIARNITLKAESQEPSRFGVSTVHIMYS